MAYKKSAVSVGLQFENNVLNLLTECGIKAFRTNKSNSDDPKEYKAGFDGGVDIIGRYSPKGKIYREFTFYIQCKCHKNGLTKSAISEVYAGMHARNSYGDGNIPVVIASGDATVETLQFAKSLGVELILDREMALIAHARATKSIEYANYGILMKVILYHYTNDWNILNRLPYTIPELTSKNMRQELYKQTKIDLDRLQSKWDYLAMQESKLQQERQRTLDSTKAVMLRNVQLCDFSRNSHEKHIGEDEPTIGLDSG